MSAAAKKKWAAANPTYQRDWARRKRQDPDYRKQISAKTRQWQKRNPIKNALLQYRNSAKHKGLILDLTEQQQIALITSPCYYCGHQPDPVNGIDRIDSNSGYLPTNTVPACRQCNIAKLTYSVSDFIAWVRRVAAHTADWEIE